MLLQHTHLENLHRLSRAFRQKNAVVLLALQQKNLDNVAT